MFSFHFFFASNDRSDRESRSNENCDECLQREKNDVWSKVHFFSEKSYFSIVCNISPILMPQNMTHLRKYYLKWKPLNVITG